MDSRTFSTPLLLGAGSPGGREELSVRIGSAKIFQGMNSALGVRLAERSDIVRLCDQEHLWRAGELARNFTVILRGLVQVVRRSPSGRGATIGVFGPLECVGAAATLRAGSHASDVIAASPVVEALHVEAGPVLEALATDTGLARSIQQHLSDQTHLQRALLEIPRKGSVPRRLARFVLHLAHRFGSEGDSGATTVPVPLSSASVSRLVAARPDTVARTLAQWRQEGWFVETEDAFRLDDVRPLRALTDAV